VGSGSGGPWDESGARVLISISDQTRAAQDRVAPFRVARVRAAEVGLREIDVTQVSAREHRIPQVCAAKDRLAEVSTAVVGRALGTAESPCRALEAIAAASSR
jgi:hypothetical protein